MPLLEVRRQNTFEKLAFWFLVFGAAFWLWPLSDVFGQEQSETSIEILATFDYPGATWTTCNGINDRGDVVGSFYDDIDLHFRGFVRFRDGRFSDPIEGPNNPEATYATDIGGTSTVCGYSWDPFANVFHGYFRRGETFRFYTVEGATSTSIGGINRAGHFAGSYGFFAYGPDGCYINANDQITTFSIPEADYHRVTAINNADTVVGWYYGYPNGYHGFLRDADSGEVTYIDFPDSSSTFVTGINDNGGMVGYYNAHRSVHGFLYKAGASASFRSYDYPDSGSNVTHFGGINNRGLICGDYSVDNGAFNHGFILKVR